MNEHVLRLPNIQCRSNVGKHSHSCNRTSALRKREKKLVYLMIFFFFTFN